MVLLLRPRRVHLLPVLLALGYLVSLLQHMSLLLVEPSARPPSNLQESLDRFRNRTTASSSNDPTHFGKNASLDTPAVAACLLIKDDNAILPEWLAYHYYALNMRSLVVAVDPSSVSSPADILRAWRQWLPDLRIVEWTDTNFMPRRFLVKGYYIPPSMIKGDARTSKWHVGNETAEEVIADKLRIHNHRYRQATFLSACLRHFRRKGGKWVFHIDTDEYVVINPIWRRRARGAMTIIKLPPSPRNPSAVIAVLQQVMNDPERLRSANHPCISLPRLLFGSKEDDAGPIIRAPEGFNASRFETLRWKYHTAYDDKERNAQPKVLVDVSMVPADDEMFERKPFSIHRPSKVLCRPIDSINMTRIRRFPLSVNHYLGTWERYIARNDTRRSARFYQYKAHVQDGKDTWMAGWLHGFVENYGEAAQHLLPSYKEGGPSSDLL